MEFNSKLDLAQKWGGGEVASTDGLSLLIAYDEAKRLYNALEMLTPFERSVVERFYLLQDSVKEISCDGNDHYYDYVRIKNKALKKLKKYI